MDKPFEIGDRIKVKTGRNYKSLFSDEGYDVVRIVTNIHWIGEGHSESGWLVDAQSPEGGYEIKNYDSNWFVKV